MTPAASTPAARGKKAKSSRSASPPRPSEESAHRSAGNRRTAAAPSRPRRVSGPVSGHTAPRRPAQPPRTPRRSARPAARKSRQLSVAARVKAFVRGLPDHSLLDQIIRGRAWIPLLGVLLAGIVAMQVEVLKLSANMGRSLERGTALQSRNEQLRASVAELGDDQRIERMAANMGLVMPGPAQVKFLATSDNGQIGRALAHIKAPDPTAFTAALPSNTAGTANSTSGGGATSTGVSAGVGVVPTSPVTSATTTGSADTTGSAATTGTSATSTGVTTTPGVAASPASTSASGGPSTVSPSTGATGASAGAAVPGAASTGG